MTLFGFASRLFYHVMTKGKDYADLLAQLERTQDVVYTRMLNAKDTTLNRERAAHVIGIERWGARRLRVLLGEPLVMDEYDGYAPSTALSMAELAEEFKQTREATAALVRQLRDAGVKLDQTVKHNEAGDLSAAGWIYYVENHAWRETGVLTWGLGSKKHSATTSTEQRG